MFFKRLICGIIVFAFAWSGIVPPPAYAQNIPNTPHILSLTLPFHPVMIQGMRVHPDNPLRFDFIVDTGDASVDINGPQFKQETTKLIKYFLASLTVPEKEMWVNLSPYEKNRIIANGLGQTELGRDMLSQDYILKQLTSSLIYPESTTGKTFWEKVYTQARKTFGSTDIPVNTFNKVWIVPDKAVVYERGNTVYIAESHLKVMLEEDYLALQKHSVSTSPSSGVIASPKGAKQSPNDVNALGAQIVREIVLPELEKEVNNGRNFAQLRQIYNAMILAVWFKLNLRKSLLGQVYADKDKTAGVDAKDKAYRQKIYEEYIRSFKRGVYNYIKEENDPVTGEMVPRKYFSGGENFVGLNAAMLKVKTGPVPRAVFDRTRGKRVEVDSAMQGVVPESADSAMSAQDIEKNNLMEQLSSAAQQWTSSMSIEEIQNVLEGNDSINSFRWDDSHVMKGLTAVNGYLSALEQRLGAEKLSRYVRGGDYLNYLSYVVYNTGNGNAKGVVVDLLEKLKRRGVTREEFGRIVTTLEEALNVQKEKLGYLRRVMENGYQAQLSILDQEQTVSLRNKSGEEYAVFNLQSLVNEGAEGGMIFQRYERHVNKNGEEEYVFYYEPENVSQSKLAGQEIHLVFGKENVDYFIRVIPKPGEVVRIGRVNFLSGSEQRFKDIFTPQANKNDVRYYPSDQSSILVSARQTPEQFGDGSSWQFTPPPFAVGLRLSDTSKEWMMVGLAVQPGHYNFNSLDYYGDQEKFNFSIDFGRHEKTEPEGWESPHFVINFANDPYQGLENYRHVLEERGLVSKPQPQETMPSWWKGFMFCGWGAQHAEVSHKRFVKDALDAGGRLANEALEIENYATQANYEKWIKTLEEAGLSPDNITLDEGWQQDFGVLKENKQRWPNLRGFIDEQHAKGRHVILWFGFWLDDGQLKDENGNKLSIDPTDPRFEAALRKQVRYALSKDGLDADGFKIDITANIPPIEHRFHDENMGGTEVLKRYVDIVRDEAKKIKPDAFIEDQIPNPYFPGPKRLNDMNGYGDNIIDVMTHRAKIAAAGGATLIDPDNWSITDPKVWLTYMTQQKHLLGGRPDVAIHHTTYYADELPSLRNINGHVSIAWELKRFAQFLQEEKLDAAMVSRATAAPVKIVMVSPEITPFFQVGGMADVVGQLSRNLVAVKRTEDEIITISVTNSYETLPKGYIWEDTHKEVSVNIGNENFQFSILKAQGTGVIHYFLMNGQFRHAPQPEDAIILAKGTFEALKVLNISPSIIHSQDWHGGLLPLYLKTLYQNDPSGLFKNTKSMLTVQNMGITLGLKPDEFYKLGIDPVHFGGLEWHGRLNFMKGGLYHADLITTVSDEYAREIQTSEYGGDLAGILRQKALEGELISIPNKLNSGWHLKQPKFEAKKSLQQELGLAVSANTPILAVISRLNAYQKGMDLVVEKIREVLKNFDVQFVLLGTGDEYLEKEFTKLKDEFPGRVSINIVFDRPTNVKINEEEMPLSELIYEGADFFLMPSRYEPGSMAILKAMGKETIPIVRNTGSLADIKQFNSATGEGYGFKFQNSNSQEMYEAVKEAIETYQHPAQWQKVLTNLRQEDLSWTPSANRYFDTYLKMATSDQPGNAGPQKDNAMFIKDDSVVPIVPQRFIGKMPLGVDKKDLYYGRLDIVYNPEGADAEQFPGTLRNAKSVFINYSYDGSSELKSAELVRTQEGTWQVVLNDAKGHNEINFFVFDEHGKQDSLKYKIYLFLDQNGEPVDVVDGHAHAHLEKRVVNPDSWSSSPFKKPYYNETTEPYLGYEVVDTGLPGALMSGGVSKVLFFDRDNIGAQELLKAYPQLRALAWVTLSDEVYNAAPGFAADQFTGTLSPSKLLRAITDSGISVPNGNDDIDKLNNLLKTKGLGSRFPGLELPSRANDLIKRETQLTEYELMQLNRMRLDRAYPESPKIHMMPPESVDKDVMDFLKNNPGVVGLKLHPTIDKVKLDDERVEALLSELAKLKHPAGRKYVVLSHADWTYGEPYQFKKLAEKFPDINFIFGHLFISDNWGKRMEAFEVDRTHDNVFLETSWLPKEVIVEAVKRAGAAKVLFGADAMGPEHYVRRSYGDIIKYLHEHLTAEEFALVMSGNARRLFGFDENFSTPAEKGPANTVVVDGIGSDHAQIAHLVYEPLQKSILSSTPGGIDLNASMLNLQVKGDGKGMAFPVGAGGRMQVNGFTPIIIRITPMSSPLLSDSG